MQASGPESSGGEKSAIEAEAARLLVKLSNSPTPQEEQEVCAWIKADPHHAVAFARAEMAWEETERLKCSAADVTLPPMEAVVGEVDRRRISRNVLIVAAVAIMLFMVATIVTVRTFSGVDRYETQIGEIRDIALPDGSTIHLNSDSQAEARYTDNGRKVRIVKGEASFDVAHDPQRPFDVVARSATIRAIGTAFNVRIRPSLVELTVTKGTVSVRADDDADARQVSAGHGAIIRPGAIVLTSLGSRLVDQRTAWRKQMVELNGDTIEQASEEFNRYRKAPILIGDPRVSALRIGGRFGVTDSKQFLAALEVSLPVRAIDGEDGSVMLLYRDDGSNDGNIR